MYSLGLIEILPYEGPFNFVKDPIIIILVAILEKNDSEKL